ncbi:MAG: hypothetical protein K2G89_00600 [Lachnospiraceae bacterium]|nr:hypothetical protein [Lachnospiraceae bacterium]
MQGNYAQRIGYILAKIVRIVVIVVALVTVVLTGFLSTKLSNYELRANVLDYAGRINEALLEKESVAQMMAGTISNDVVTEDSDVLSYMDSVVAENKNISAAYIVYADNKLIMSGGWQPDEPMDFTARDWYTGAAGTEGVYTSEPYVDKQSGLLCVTMCQRVMDEDGNIRGVVAIDLYPDDIVSIVSADNNKKRYAFLVTKAGTILTHPDSELALSADKSVNIQDADGGKYKKVVGTDLERKTMFEMRDGGCKFLMARTIGSAQWQVIYAEPAVDSYGTFILIIIVSVIFAVGASYLVGKYCARALNRWFVPLASIGEKAVQISEGNLDVVFDEEPIAEEIAMLTVSMNETVEKLKVIISDISHVVNRISANDLCVGVEAEYQGAFVAIKNSLETILDKLNGAFGMVNEQSEIVVNYSGQMQESTLQVANGATEQSMVVSGLADNIKVLAEQSEHITKNAEKASEVSELTNNQLAEGNEQMKELLAAMDTIEETSRQIGAIITTINDISEQTNLLSLNASIEAARAGEAGRGFAVVADEISKLATASAASSDTIAQLIDDSSKAVQQGKRLAYGTSNTLQTGIANSMKSKDDILEITQFVRNQGDAIAKIEDSIRNIVSIIDSNAAASQENAAISDELINCASALKETVDEFHLRGQVYDTDEMPEEEYDDMPEEAFDSEEFEDGME